MMEKYLEQMNLEADAQINTRCPTTQHSHDSNHGQALPGWATGQQVSQEPVGSGDGQQEGPRRQQAWAENQEGSSENQQEWPENQQEWPENQQEWPESQQGEPENQQGEPESQQLEAPEEAETSEPTSKNKKRPGIWKRIKMSIPDVLSA
ncbi:antigen LPMC-61-like [Salmo salar]|uniref:Antigen LPMC-61-like n=1 Tax=Salmo salar TaxID=8030 RepID=A0ABM3EB22_SALSA|nr:antigen LPMC-61-like [Salmo salar]